MHATFSNVLDPAQIAPDTTRPLKRAEYERLVDLGFFEDERVELLYGTVVQMSPHGPQHDAVIQRLTRLLVVGVGDRGSVRIQSAFAASDGSEPEPDVAVVPPGDYDDAHPTEAWLIVEVAETSLPKDRGLKAKLYAESGVDEYWVVNLVDGIVEVFTEIVNAAYTRVTPHRAGAAFRPGRFPDVEVAVSHLLR